MCLSEMRRGTPCCSSPWFCHVSTTAYPPRPPWCSGSTSRTVGTARGIRSTSPTAWVEAREEVGWRAEPEEPVDCMRRGWRRATWTALTAAGRSELWPPSLVLQSHCRSTTRAETSPSSTVRLLLCYLWFCFSDVRVEKVFSFQITQQLCSQANTFL